MEHSEFEREAMSGWGDPSGAGHDGTDTRHDLDGAVGATAHGGERLDAVATLDPPDAAEARTWDDLGGSGLDTWTDLNGPETPRSPCTTTSSFGANRADTRCLTASSAVAAVTVRVGE